MSVSSAERARRQFAVQVTVGNFLKVYEKLGLSSREQLSETLSKNDRRDPQT